MQLSSGRRHPIHAVDAGRQIDGSFELPVLEIENFDLSGSEEGNVGDAAVGADQHFAKSSWSVKSFCQLACVQIDYKDVTLHAGADEPVIVGRGFGRINSFRH